MDPSKLRERLESIVGGPIRLNPDPRARAGTSEHGVREDPASAGLASNASYPPSETGALAFALGGEWRELHGARCFVVERRLSADAVHGRATVGVFGAEIDAALPSAPLLANGATAPTPLLFFDLETTGLSGGAGTFAFLIGCGWFDRDGAFVTRQYVLTRLTDERMLLRGFGEELARAGALVSFNGRTFDAPVLETRYLYHRLAWPAGEVPHLDMLHPARRFWSSRGECSLVALERSVLATGRVGDVPGFEIPARYFQFVRTGDARPLAPVLAHNRLDLLSLAGVTARLLRLVARGERDAERACEALALGRVYARAALDERADAAWRHAAALAAEEREPAIRVEAFRALAIAARRRREHHAAADWWRQVLAVPNCPRDTAREATEALAIHHEHRLRDLKSARTFALTSLDADSRPAWVDAVRHRLARLDRKMRLLDL